jgi:hypothetical protein
VHNFSTILDYVCSSFSFFLMPFSGIGISFFTYGSLRHLVGLLGQGISPVPRPLPTQDNTTQRNTDTHPCPEQDSNLWSQCSSGWRQYLPQTTRLLRPADYIRTTQKDASNTTVYLNMPSSSLTYNKVYTWCIWEISSPYHGFDFMLSCKSAQLSSSPPPQSYHC